MKNIWKIKYILVSLFFIVMGFCFLGVFNADAIEIGRYGIDSVSSSGDDYFINPRWITDEDGYSSISYGSTSELGVTTRITDSEEITSDHELSVPNLNNDDVRYVRLEVYDYPDNSGPYIHGFPFKVAVDAPYLYSITSDIDTANNNCGGNTNCVCSGGTCTFGPGSDIDIIANFRDHDYLSDSDADISGTPSMSVRLNIDDDPNTGGVDEREIALTDDGNGNSLSGTYTVGQTGTLQNVSDLDISLIVGGQNVCNSASVCVDNEVLPAPYRNLGELKNIAIDTTAPTISNFEPISTNGNDISHFNNTTSPIQYQIDETLSSGSITFEDENDEDEIVDITCTLSGTALTTVGSLKTIYLDNTDIGNNCGSDILSQFDDGETYTVVISGTDLHGNESEITTSEGVIFDISSPILQSFSAIEPTPAKDYYDTNDVITIVATFDERLDPSSTMTVELNSHESNAVANLIYPTPDEGEELTNDEKKTLVGTYTVGTRNSEQKTMSLAVSDIPTHSVVDLAGNTSIVAAILGNINDDIIVDTLGYNVQYYSDSGFTTEIDTLDENESPHLKEGTYYIAITPTDTVTGDLIINIDTEDDANNVTNETVSDTNALDSNADNIFKLERSIGSTEVDGGVNDQEIITIDGRNSLNHLKEGMALEDTSKAGYPDTIAPTINFDASGSEYDFIGDGDTINVTVDFYEIMDDNEGYYPYVCMGKTDQDCSVDFEESQGRYTSSDKSIWSTSLIYNDFSGIGIDDGEWTIRTSEGRDLAGNERSSDEQIIATIDIDTVDPEFGEVADAVSSNWTKIDSIAGTITTDDTVSVKYGFTTSEENKSCNSSISYGSDNVLSGNNFSFSIGANGEDRPVSKYVPEWLCLEATDGAGNKVYYNFGGQNELHVDNTQPTIESIYAIVSSSSGNPIEGSYSYSAGETVYLRMIFSEEVVLNEGESLVASFDDIDTTCEFTEVIIDEEEDEFYSDCSFEVQSTDQTDGKLELISPIVGTAHDFVDGNELNKEVPSDGNFQQGENVQYIELDGSAPNLLSFSAEPSSGTFGPGEEIVITATYSENLGAGSMTIILNNGVELKLESRSGATLFTTYLVGDQSSEEINETVSNLIVTEIKEHSVFDETIPVPNENNLTDLPAEDSNISPGINIDTAGPIFSVSSPITGQKMTETTGPGSNISFSISEDLENNGTAKIFFDAVGGSLSGPGYDRTCILSEDYLSAGEYLRFDTTQDLGCTNFFEEPETGSIYEVSFFGYDEYGNVSNFNPITGVTYGDDSELPNITDCYISNITTSSAKINWVTDEPTDAFVDYGLTTSFGKTVGSDVVSDPGTTHGETIYGLEEETEYYFQLRSTDLNGNERTHNSCRACEDTDECLSPISPAYFETASSTGAIPDITNVEITDITFNGAKITWDTSNVTSDSYIEYWEDGDEGNTSIYGSYQFTTEHSVVLPSDLEAETTYRFKIKSTDNSLERNEAISESDDYVFTTLEEPAGGNNPGPGNLNISSISVSEGEEPNTAVITWKTDDDANGSVRYGLDNTYGQTAADDLTIEAGDSLSVDHSVTLRNLLSNTTYHYKVISYDVFGNIAASSDRTFSTETLQLASEPRVTNAGANSVVIVWETIDPTFSAIEYGKSDSYGDSFEREVLTNLHRVELTGLDSGEVYHFKVSGSDEDSVYSKDYMFGTFDSPIISGLATDEVTDISAKVSWNVSVPSESYVEYKNVDDEEDNGTQGASGLQTENAVILTGLTQGSRYSIQVKGIDVNKKEFESEEISITTLIDETPPVISQVSTDSSLVTGKEDKVQTIVSWKTDEISTSQVAFGVGGGEDSEFDQKSKEDSNLTTNHLVVLTNLRSGTVYNFKVVSKDKNGNTSESQNFTLLTPQKQQSVIQMIIANFEQSFGFLKKLKK